MHMKLRIKGNSVRLRLDRRDLAELVDTGRVDDAVRFGPGANQALSYAVELGPDDCNRSHIRYSSGQLVATVDRDQAVAWQQSELVGFDHQQQVEGGVVRLIIEKDFAC